MKGNGPIRMGEEEYKKFIEELKHPKPATPELKDLINRYKEMKRKGIIKVK